MVSKTDDRAYREIIKQQLRQKLEKTIDSRVERLLEINHHGLIPDHYFVNASTECIDLYRDGYFISAVMVSQSVAEGIWRFVLERNNIPPNGDRPTMAKPLVERKILTQNCVDAFIRIWQSFRNDVHHMNPKVSKVPFNRLAKQNLIDLGIIEREIFAYKITSNRRILPEQQKYWDVQPDGTTEIFLRSI